MSFFGDLLGLVSATSAKTATTKLQTQLNTATSELTAAQGQVSSLTTQHTADVATISSLTTQLANAGTGTVTGLAGTFDLNLSMNAGESLFEPSPPDSTGGWTLSATGAVPPCVALSGSKIVRGTAVIGEGTTYTLPLKWSKTGQADKPFALTFRGTATTPLFSYVQPPVLLINSDDLATQRKDVYVVAGQYGKTIPVAVAWVDASAGKLDSYYLSRTAKFLLKNGVSDGTPGPNLGYGDYLGISAEDGNGSYSTWFPYKGNRQMLTITMADGHTSAVGHFQLELDFVDAPQIGGNVTKMTINIVIVGDASQIPAGYKAISYAPSTAIAPVWNPPATPTIDDNLLTMDIRQRGAAPFSKDYWISYGPDDLNPPNDFSFAMPGVTTTDGGHLLTMDDLLPIRTIGGQQVRCQVIKDLGSDTITYHGVKRRFCSAPLQRNLLPQYGFLEVEVMCSVMPGVDGGPTIWRFNGFEDDLLEVFPSLSNIGTTTAHDGADIARFSMSAYSSRATDSHMLRRFYIGKNKRYAWVADPDGSNPQLLSESPNAFVGLIWDYVNLILEGPGGAAGSPDYNQPYAQYQNAIFRVRAWWTDGNDY